MTDRIAKLLADAERFDRAGEEAQARGDVAAAVEAYAQAHIARQVAAGLEAATVKTLPSEVKSRTVKTGDVLTPEHKAAISATKTRGKNALLEHARQRDPLATLDSIAAAAGISPALLSMAYRGQRAMPERSADIIQRRYGYPKSRWARLS